MRDAPKEYVEMTDPIVPTPTPGDPATPPPASPEPADDGATELADVKAQLHRVNAESASRRKQIDTLTAELTDARPKAAQLVEYEAIVKELLDSKVKALGDKAKKAVEALPEGTTVLAKLKWLAANEELFTPTAPSLGAPGRGTRQSGAATNPQAAPTGPRNVY